MGLEGVEHNSEVFGSSPGIMKLSFTEWERLWEGHVLRAMSGACFHFV